MQAHGEVLQVVELVDAPMVSAQHRPHMMEGNMLQAHGESVQVVELVDAHRVNAQHKLHVESHVAQMEEEHPDPLLMKPNGKVRDRRQRPALHGSSHRSKRTHKHGLGVRMDTYTFNDLRRLLMRTPTASGAPSCRPPPLGGRRAQPLQGL